jgi:hypothetical protein
MLKSAFKLVDQVRGCRQRLLLQVKVHSILNILLRQCP